MDTSLTIRVEKYIDSVIRGDNLDVMRNMPSGFVDLCYIDPPFDSGTDRHDFEDNWKSKTEYIEFIRPRLKEIHRLLKKSGSIYLHCDSSSNARLRLLLDEIFGEDNFGNEIIWHYRRWGSEGKCFSRMHDTIYFYAKKLGENTFNQLFEPLSEETMRRTGGMRVKTVFKQTGEKNITMECEESPGAKMHDVWSIPVVAGQANERSGYATQKPVSLLRRVIEASSIRGDIVFDPFCGSGTTLVASKMLDRRYIGIDMNPEAVEISIKQLNDSRVEEFIERRKEKNAADKRPGIF